MNTMIDYSTITYDTISERFISLDLTGTIINIHDGLHTVIDTISVASKYKKVFCRQIVDIATEVPASTSTEQAIRELIRKEELEQSLMFVNSYRNIEI